MIHIFVGTKAQFIKMAPIMQELDRRSVSYNFIDAGQHAGLTGDLLRQFGLRYPDVRLRNESRDIATLAEAIKWVAGNLAHMAFRRGEVAKRVFRGNGGICLIHGDTLTTLLSLLYAKSCGIKVAHVEAGLRSYHLLNPFPEEAIRRIAMRYSDMLFASSPWALENLKASGHGEKAVDIGANTIVDTIRYALQRAEPSARPAEPYVVFTIHRLETLYSRKRLEIVTRLARQIAMKFRVCFVLHEPTRRQLARYGLLRQLAEDEAVTILRLQPYLSFLALLSGATFIVTDGGSIQEESYYLNVPCMVMRTKTEREEGLGENVWLVGFDQSEVEKFIQAYPTLRTHAPMIRASPTSRILEALVPWT